MVIGARNTDICGTGYTEMRIRTAYENHFWYTMLLVAVISSILTLFLQCALIKCWKKLVKKLNKKDDKDNQNVFELKKIDPESLRSRNKNASK